MKLKNLDNPLFQKAIDIYLSVAYKDATVPPNVLALSNFKDSTSRWVEDVRVEKDESLGNNRFFLRLGNFLYPHMKLGVVECSGLAGEFVFVADTHDRHFELVEGLPDLEEFQTLQSQNEVIKKAIEAKWTYAGIPTASIFDDESSNEKKQNNDFHLLVVDDTKDIRIIIEKRMTIAGFQVTASDSAITALEVIKSQHVDLCILDVMMPKINGFEFIEALIGAGLKTFPIILATAVPEQQLRKDLADDYILKPFAPEYLVKKVNALLGIG